MRTAVLFFTFCVAVAALVAFLSGQKHNVNQVQETPPAVTQEAQEPQETQKVKEEETGVIVIQMPEGFDGDLDNLMIGIQVEGMPKQEG